MKAPNIKRCMSAALCGLFALTSVVSTAIISSSAEDEITVEKTLVDFSLCDTGADFELPERMEFISGSEHSNYGGTQTVKEKEDGSKYLNIAIDKKVQTAQPTTVKNSKSRIAFGVTVPSNYINYIDGITLKYSNDVKQSNKKTNMYALIGVTDGTNYGKTAESALNFESGSDKELSVKMSDMLKTNLSGFLGKYSGSTKWTADDTANLTEILVYVTMPTAAGNEGWNVGIEGLSVTLKGDSETIKNIDKINPLIENFDDFDSLAEIKAKGVFANSGPNVTLTDKANSEPNAVLYKSKGEGTDYDTCITLNLDKRVADVKGITFKMRNLDTANAEAPRCFVETKNAKGENVTYQVIASAPIDDGKFRTVRIYFDDIGQKTGDYFWGGTSSGYTMTSDEIRNIYALRIRIPYMGTHEGVVFDDFNYMVEDDRITRTVTLFDFDNCKAGDSLPDGITKSGSYGGTTEMVTDAEGKTSYRINFDKKESAAASKDKINERGYIWLTVPVPAGMLYDCAEIRLNVTKKGNTESTVPYLMTVNDGNAKFGKADQSSQHISKTEGDYLLTTSLNGLLTVNNTWNLTNWVNPNGNTKWTNDDLATVQNIVLYVAAPTCDGTEGYYLDIHSVELFYRELPEYTETATRTVFSTKSTEKTDSEKISASVVELNATDKNYRKFSEKIQIVTKDKDNTDYITFTNRCINFRRDLTPFTETATLFMYARSDVKTTLKMNFVTKSGDRMPFEIPLEASDDFEDIKFSVKALIEEFYKNEPDSEIELDDVFAIEMLPVADKASTVEISCFTVWSFDVGELGGSTSWYYYENGVAVEAYNDYLAKTDVATVGTGDTADMIKEWDIKVPSGLTPVLYKNISLFNKNGDTIEPGGNIWLTFDLPDGTDLNTLSIYHVYFDGSLKSVRHVIETDKLSVNVFQVGSFMIFSGKATGETTDKTDKSEETDNTDTETDIGDSTDNGYDNNWESDYDSFDYSDGEYVDGGDSAMSEKNDGEQTEQVVRRKKMVRKKKKNTESGLGVLEWSLIGAGALVVIAGGTVLTVVLVKKKRKGAVK